MLHLKIKDYRLRKLYLKNEKKLLINRFLFIYFLNTLKSKNYYFYYFLIQKNSKLSSKIKTKLVRRCALTNRARGNFRGYSLSRFTLRNFIQFGILPGFKKAVW